MLLEFSIKNYKPIKDTARFSLAASNYDKSTLELNNVETLPAKNLRVLRSAVMYGANASGKTKFMEALKFFRDFVLNSSKEGQQGESIDIQPFLLAETTKTQPSEFEVVFESEGSIYRYGFEVTKDRVLSEWLFYRPDTREIQLFYRDTVEESIETHKKLFPKGGVLHREKLVRKNALLLSVAAQFNDEICSFVLNWLKDRVAIISCTQDTIDRGLMGMRNMDSETHARIMQLVRDGELGISDLEPNSMGVDSDTHAAIHTIYDQSQTIAGTNAFSLKHDESPGTRKFLYLSWRLLDAIDGGKTLCIDQFDAQLHPKLVICLFSLFNDREHNPNGSQLIINAQNTVLLQSDLLRKDQIWFIEKDRSGSSRLYSLSDFISSKVRNNENFEANYLRGKYGGVPSVDGFGSES